MNAAYVVDVTGPVAHFSAAAYSRQFTEENISIGNLESVKTASKVDQDTTMLFPPCRRVS